jgi:hypothetical protein
MSASGVKRENFTHGPCVGMTSDVVRTFDTITDLHKVLTELRGEPAVNRTTMCKQRFGFWF